MQEVEARLRTSPPLTSQLSLNHEATVQSPPYLLPVDAARGLLEQSAASTSRASQLQTDAANVLNTLRQLAEAAELSDVEALEGQVADVAPPLEAGMDNELVGVAGEGRGAAG